MRPLVISPVLMVTTETYTSLVFCKFYKEVLIGVLGFFVRIFLSFFILLYCIFIQYCSYLTLRAPRAQTKVFSNGTEQNIVAGYCALSELLFVLRCDRNEHRHHVSYQEIICLWNRIFLFVFNHSLWDVCLILSLPITLLRLRVCVCLCVDYGRPVFEH